MTCFGAHLPMLQAQGLPQYAFLLVAILLLKFSTEGTSIRDSAFIGWSEQRKADYRIVLETQFGKIHIIPRVDISPSITQMVAALAEKGSCTSCHFYRHEPVPQDWSLNGFWGPPYALLQGSLADLPDMPPFEGHPAVKRGDVCMIPNCKEFFIATADHDEWGTAHTVWGKVEDNHSWATIQRMPVEPFTAAIDNNNITTRWLRPEAHIKFALSLESA